VERRGEDLEHGVHALARLTSQVEGPTAGMPERLVQALLPEGPDDDVAVLVARVDPPEGEQGIIHRFEAVETAVVEARHLVARHLSERSVPHRLVDDAVLTTSELLTNAIVHGVGPIDMRLRTNRREVLVEVQDRATFQPRKLRPTAEDEHGRGLQIVAALSERWGTRATEDGKSVWCVLSAGSSEEPDLG
jgi:anti-sigma regulatory factor (Ser/Thr protein kinase)